jgi:cytochrome c556
MHKFVAAFSLAAAALAAAPAHAQFAKGEDAIRYRQSVFVIMGAQLKADKPNVATIQSATAVLASVAPLAGEGFVPGSETGGVPPTKAKPELFLDGPKVAALSKKMNEEVAKLNVAAKGGDVKAIQAAFGAVGQSCKACHDDYRAK